MAMRTEQVIVSMTSTLIAYLRGEFDGGLPVEGADWKNREENPKYWFNCWRSHLFDHIPCEASWALDTMKSCHDQQEMDLAIENGEYDPKIIRGVKSFRILIEEAERNGLVSWRDRREQK